MTESSDANTATNCPLCGQPNDCAVAAGRDPESCWCMGATIDPALLATVPAEAQGKVCICARCASRSPAAD